MQGVSPRRPRPVDGRVSPGIARCSTPGCDKVLPVRITDEALEALADKRVVILTVYCPKCWRLNRVSAEDVRPAA